MVALPKPLRGGKICKACRAPFVRKPDERKDVWKRRQACSTQCATELARRSRANPVVAVPRPCLACGKIIPRLPTDGPRAYNRRKACSKQCGLEYRSMRGSIHGEITFIREERAGERRAKQASLPIPKMCECGNPRRVEVVIKEGVHEDGTPWRTQRVIHAEYCERCTNADGVDPTSADVISALRGLGGSAQLDAIADEFGGGEAGQRQAYRGLAKLRAVGRVKVYSCDGDLMPDDTTASASNAHGYPFTYVLKETW